MLPTRNFTLLFTRNLTLLFTRNLTLLFTRNLTLLFTRNLTLLFTRNLTLLFTVTSPRNGTCFLPGPGAGRTMSTPSCQQYLQISQCWIEKVMTMMDDDRDDSDNDGDVV